MNRIKIKLVSEDNKQQKEAYVDSRYKEITKVPDLLIEKNDLSLDKFNAVKLFYKNNTGDEGFDISEMPKFKIMDFNYQTQKASNIHPQQGSMQEVPVNAPQLPGGLPKAPQLPGGPPKLLNVPALGGVPASTKKVNVEDKAFIESAKDFKIISFNFVHDKKTVQKVAFPINFVKSGFTIKLSGKYELTDSYINPILVRGKKAGDEITKKDSQCNDIVKILPPQEEIEDQIFYPIEADGVYTLKAFSPDSINTNNNAALSKSKSICDLISLSKLKLLEGNITTPALDKLVELLKLGKIKDLQKDIFYKLSKENQDAIKTIIEQTYSKIINIDYSLQDFCSTKVCSFLKIVCFALEKDKLQSCIDLKLTKDGLEGFNQIKEFYQGKPEAKDFLEILKFNTINSYTITKEQFLNLSAYCYPFNLDIKRELQKIPNKLSTEEIKALQSQIKNINIEAKTKFNQYIQKVQTDFADLVTSSLNYLGINEPIKIHKSDILLKEFFIDFKSSFVSLYEGLASNKKIGKEITIQALEPLKKEIKTKKINLKSIEETLTIEDPKHKALKEEITKLTDSINSIDTQLEGLNGQKIILDSNISKRKNISSGITSQLTEQNFIKQATELESQIKTNGEMIDSVLKIVDALNFLIHNKPQIKSINFCKKLLEEYIDKIIDFSTDIKTQISSVIQEFKEFKEDNLDNNLNSVKKNIELIIGNGYKILDKLELSNLNLHLSLKELKNNNNIHIKALIIKQISALIEEKEQLKEQLKEKEDSATQYKKEVSEKSDQEAIDELLKDTSWKNASKYNQLQEFIKEIDDCVDFNLLTRIQDNVVSFIDTTINSINSLFPEIAKFEKKKQLVDEITENKKTLTTLITAIQKRDQELKDKAEAEKRLEDLNKQQEAKEEQKAREEKEDDDFKTNLDHENNLDKVKNLVKAQNAILVKRYAEVIKQNEEYAKQVARTLELQKILNDKLEESKKEVPGLKAQIKQLNEANVKLSENLDPKKIKDLESQIKDLTSKNIQDILTQKADFNQKIKDLENQIKDLEAAKDKGISDLRKENDIEVKKEAEKLALNLQIIALTFSNTDLANEKILIQNEKTVVEGENVILIEKKAALELEQDDLTTVNKTLTDDKKIFQAENDDIAVKNSSKDLEIRDLQKALSDTNPDKDLTSSKSAEGGQKHYDIELSKHYHDFISDEANHREEATKIVKAKIDEGILTEENSTVNEHIASEMAETYYRNSMNPNCIDKFLESVLVGEDGLN